MKLNDTKLDGMNMADTNMAEALPGSQPQTATLANGMRVVTHNMPHLETVSLGVWVSCGSRHEAPQDNGISHFLEHMAFKGTARRSARQIVEEIEQVGGDLNAATSLETTAYYAPVLKDDVPLALDLLGDILNNPSYLEAEIERERGVILQEIAAAKDVPEELAYDIVQELSFPDQAVGRPILGTTESVGGFSAGDLRRFLGEHYTPDRMVVSAAGAVEHDAVVRHAEAQFGGSLKDRKGKGKAPEQEGDGALQQEAQNPGVKYPGAKYQGTKYQEAKYQEAKYQGGAGFLDRPFEQSHMLMGFKAPSYLDPDVFAAQVFSGLLGGGMSSRLFQEVRERRGLCYSIYSSCWGLRDAGVFNIYAATSPESVTELVDVVSQQLALAAAEAPGESELARAKAQMKAGLLMSLESSSARAEQMARHLMVYGRLLTTSELVAKVEAVSAEGVRQAAERLLVSAPASFAIVGPGASAHEAAARGLQFQLRQPAAAAHQVAGLD